MTASKLDSLKRSVTPDASSSKSKSRSGWWLIALPLGFLLLCFLLFGERLMPRLEVKTAPALLLDSATPDSETQENFTPQTVTQASGWIEPDPYPIRIPVKVDGLVETVEVLEGERVKAGQLLATLDPVDFEYHLKSQEGALLAAEAFRVEKEKSVLRAQAECERSQAGVEAAKARFLEAKDRLRRVLALEEGVIPVDDRLGVEREVAVTKAELAAAEAEWKGHMAHQEVEKAGVETANAKIIDLKAQVDRARTDVERTKIYSPVDGIILKRYANPGGKRMRGMDDPESATIVSLFNPEKLQVRVDVPLADAAGVEEGTPANIQLSLFPDREFKGTVTRVVGEADLTRNTLQVKVAVEDPDPRMRPEMLCRVEFLSLPKSGSGAGTSFRSSETVWIPQAGVGEDGKLWVVDPVSLRAEIREVEVGSETREGYRSVSKGLRPGERVVLDAPKGIKPGIRVKEINGENI